jgi:hypothetical protein
MPFELVFLQNLVNIQLCILNLAVWLFLFYQIHYLTSKTEVIFSFRVQLS